MSKNIQLDKENKLLILDNGAIKIFRHVESAGSFADDTVALTPEAAGKLKLALSNLVYETTVFDEYNEIVKIIDDRFEYKNGNLSIVEIVKDAFSRMPDVLALAGAGEGGER